MNKIIFVAGVHGVGKSYFCEQVKQHYLFEHYSASKLIANEKQQEFESSKKIDQINENQDHLLNALSKLPTRKDPILLDGHFCIVNKKSEIVVLPYNTISSISPIGIILLINDPNVIYERMIKRDGSSAFDVGFIHAFQERERQAALVFLQKFNIPYYEHCNENSFDKVEKFIELIL